MRIQLDYGDTTSYTLADTRTHCITLELLVRHIHTVQLDERTLLLDKPSDATFACALISANPWVKRFKIV